MFDLFLYLVYKSIQFYFFFCWSFIIFFASYLSIFYFFIIYQSFLLLPIIPFFIPISVF